MSSAPPTAPARPAWAADTSEGARARQVLKDALPRTRLSLKHTQECRVLPNRLALLDHLPKGGVVAEIGVASGDYSAEILRRATPAKLHLIDAWSTSRYSPALARVRSRFDVELDKGTVVINQGLSTEVLPTFADGYFDWVYIDTDHSFDTTFAELCLSDRKVKGDGRIAGHDFCVGNVIAPVPYGVIEACLKFCVDFDWQFEFLTIEFSGNPSFAIKRGASG